MSDQIQRLIDKIKADGITAAEEEAQKIENEARLKAQDIIESAREQARNLTQNTTNQIEKKKQSAQAALQQSARDTLLALRQNIQNLLQSILQQNVKESLSASQLTDILGNLIQQTLKDSSATITLNEKDAKDVQEGLMSKLQGELKQGLEINSSNQIDSGFRISFDKDRSAFDFTDQSLVEFLTQYVNDDVSDILKEALKKEPVTAS